MSPRGVAVPNVRERLFAAAERILANDGPSGLTNRAITAEAEVSKGLLYNHFNDLDTFIAELVVDRIGQAASAATDLPGRAGGATVAENLTGAALAMLGSNGPALAGLAASRPTVSAKVRDALGEGAPSFSVLETAIDEYLEAEKGLGRVSTETDAAAVALAIVGTTHHLMMTGWPGAPDPGTKIRALVAMLSAAITPRC